MYPLFFISNIRKSGRFYCLFWTQIQMLYFVPLRTGTMMTSWYGYVYHSFWLLWGENHRISNVDRINNGNIGGASLLAWTCCWTDGRVASNMGHLVVIVMTIALASLSMHCNSFEDWALLDFSFGYAIVKWNGLQTINLRRRSVEYECALQGHQVSIMFS